MCSAPVKGGHDVRRIGLNGITLTKRGNSTNTRHINNLAGQLRKWRFVPVLEVEWIMTRGA